MSVIRNVKLGMKGLWLHRLRSFLTMLGIVFGVGSVVAMISVGQGASQQALDQIRKLGARNIVLRSQKSSKPVGTSGDSSRRSISVYGLTYQDYQRSIKIFPKIKRVAPIKWRTSYVARLGMNRVPIRLMGVTETWFDLVKRPLVAGRWLRAEDVAGQENVCVVSEKIARGQSGKNPAVGVLSLSNILNESIRLGNESFKVVGVIRTDPSEAGGVQTPDRATDVYIPLSTLRSRFGDYELKRGDGTRSMERVELHQIILEVDHMDHVASTATAVRRMLSHYHKDQDYQVAVPLSLLEQARKTQRMFTIFLASIAGISLMVGGIGIMNIMLASVTERTREIGIRRAIGATRQQIVIQFLTETLLLSLLGGCVGIIVGVYGVPLLIMLFSTKPIEPVVTLWSIFLAIGVSLFVGVLAGLYPAIRAAKLDPMLALRHE